jgi:RNA polymerase sigma-70 factor (ECF subfamily)
MPATADLDQLPNALLPQHWLELYGDGLYAYALRRVRRPELAEDLLQDTLLAGLQSLDRFGQRAQMRSWLTGILRNKINDHLRARYRHEPAELVVPEEDELFNRHGAWRTPVPKWRGDPSELAQNTELRSVLDQCVAKLPTRMSHLFISRTTDEVETPELCEQLQISEQNAWMLLHRARLRLRQCLTSNWFSNNCSKSARADSTQTTRVCAESKV